MVVVLGGVGQLAGTIVGAFGLGIINKFIEPFYGAVLAKIFVLVLIVLFIQKRRKDFSRSRGAARRPDMSSFLEIRQVIPLSVPERQPLFSAHVDGDGGTDPGRGDRRAVCALVVPEGHRCICRPTR
jgi:urea transport system permease protein